MTDGHFRHLSTSIASVVGWTVSRHRRALVRYLLLVLASVSIAATFSTIGQISAPPVGAGTLKLAEAQPHSKTVEKQVAGP